MKVVVRVFLIVLFVLLTNNSLGSDKISFVVIESDRVGYYDGETLKGFWVDVLRELSHRLDENAVPAISIAPFTRIVEIFRSNNDGYVVSILFPDSLFENSTVQVVPVAYFEMGIISLEKQAITWENITDKKIAMVLGTEGSYGPRFKQLVKSNVIAINHITRHEQGLKMLVAGRVDGILGTMDDVRYLIKKAGLETEKSLAKPLILNNMAVMLTVSVAPDISPKRSREMLTRMKNIIKAMDREEFIQNAIKSYSAPP